jgi:hypothetical protein
MKKYKHTIGLFAVLCGCIACYCTRSTVAGGSQIGNPATVVGSVETSAQHPGRGARVYLLIPQFVPAVSARDTSLDSGSLTGIIAINTDTTQFMTVTDSAGRFEIRKVPWNTYNLFIADTSNAGVAMRRNVVIDLDTVDLGNETLKMPGCVIFNISDTMFVPDGYLAVKGTPLYQKVTAPGQYSLYIPDDTISVVYSTVNMNIPTIQDSTKNVYVVSGDTIDLTGIPPVVINGSLGYLTGGRPTPLSPADTIRSDSIVEFVVSGAYSNKNSAMEYQFYIAEDTASATVTPWSFNNSYRLLVRSSGWFYIACRVRSQTQNGLMVSEWSQTCAIMIFGPAPAGFVSTPVSPRGYVFARSVDTLLLEFITGGSVSSLGDTVEYRFKWLGDTTGYHTTTWSRDTTAIVSVIPGLAACYINAQARSSRDTTIYSAWSGIDSLLLR